MQSYCPACACAGIEVQSNGCKSLLNSTLSSIALPRGRASWVYLPPDGYFETGYQEDKRTLNEVKQAACKHAIAYRPLVCVHARCFNT